MSFPIRTLAVLTLLFSVHLGLSAQSDVSGSADHPLIQRIPDSWITEYDVKDFDRYPLVTGPQKNYSNELDQKRFIEGKITRIAYQLPWGGKSPYEIYKNYENAFAARKGKPLFTCFNTSECRDGAPLRSPIGNSGLSLHGSGDFDEDFGYYSYEFSKDGKRYFAILMTGQFPSSKMLAYEIHVIEVEEMEQVVELSDIEAALAEEGKIALYGIQFATGSANLEATSQTTIGHIAAYLKAHPTVKLYVVGHTDNTGTYARNMTLSAERAAAVVTALTGAHGIPASRLQAEGVGPVAPVGTNTTDAGRQLNRRVELVVNE